MSDIRRSLACVRFSYCVPPRKTFHLDENILSPSYISITHLSQIFDIFLIEFKKKINTHKTIKIFLIVLLKNVGKNKSKIGFLKKMKLWDKSK